MVRSGVYLSDENAVEDDGIQQDDEPEEFASSSYGYWALRNMIRNEGLPLEERDRAVAEMERLAESGDRSAQYLMGKLLRDGPLLIPDSVEARHWLEQAAAQGHITAQYALGKLLLDAPADEIVHDPAHAVAAEVGIEYPAHQFRLRPDDLHASAALEAVAVGRLGGDELAQLHSSPEALVAIL